MDRAARVLGPRHPFALSALVALAAELRALGRPVEAGRAERRALTTFAAVFGDLHPHTVAARARTRPYWDFEPQIT